MEDRLQKIMARAGVGSRRHCETLIEQGRVTIDGKVAHLGQKADPRRVEIRVDGKAIKREQRRYIMVNKPLGVLSSTEDELGQGRRTVRDLVDVPGHLYPVGRLDKNSLGLMLLTNDGDMAHKLTHPRYGHKKTYLVWVEGKPSRAVIDQWRRGIDLDGKRTLPCTVKVIEEDESRTRLKIVMREGRKRQIRRVAAQLGHPVHNLLRIKLGPLTLHNVELGQWRDLAPDEVRQLRRSIKAAEHRSRRPGRQGGNRPKKRQQNRRRQRR